MAKSLRILLIALIALHPIALLAQGPIPTPAGATVSLPIVVYPSSGVNGGGIVIPAQLKFQDGTASAPSLTFASDTTTGIYKSSQRINFAISGGNQWYFRQNDGGILSDTGLFTFGAAADLVLARDAANTLAQKNSTTAQVNRLYFSTTGPVYFQQTARTNGVLFTGSGGSMQISSTQTTAPTCGGCGIAPTFTGSDSDIVLTMGSSGTPTSPFAIIFNGTWPGAVSCTASMGLGTMAIGKLPMVLAATTGQLNVTTNGTAPSASDVYNIRCGGTQ